MPSTRAWRGGAASGTALLGVIAGLSCCFARWVTRAYLHVMRQRRERTRIARTAVAVDGRFRQMG
ncbi:hypothetical protein GCM10028775_39590 [Catellatospora paridis]